MNKLELIKLFAELEGLECRVGYKSDGVEYVSVLRRWKEGTKSCCTWEEYNPFIGQLQLDARDNYGVSIVHTVGKVKFVNISVGVVAHRWCEPDAICEKVIECILESEGKL